MRKTGTKRHVQPGKVVDTNKAGSLSSGGVFAFVLLSLFVTLQTSDSLAATNDGAFSYAVRLRSESVEVGGETAAAVTAKIRLDFSHAFSKRWKTFLQLDHVNDLSGRHSDGVVLTGKPVIADPEHTEINQAYVQWRESRATVTLGRQAITFGDHRFIGDVGFRQNDQTYDGLRFEYETVEGVTLNYAYVSGVNRIFGRRAGNSLSRSDLRAARLTERPGGALGRHDVDGHLLNLDTTLADYVDLSAFVFAIRNHDHAPFSNRTAGVNAEWKYKYRQLGLSASVILARQEKQSAVAGRYQNFMRLGAGVRRGSWHAEARFERFGASSGQAFVTPLATLHKFQGWADQFLATPAEGLEDASLRLMWKARPFTVDYRFHRFDAVSSQATSSSRIGEEHDLDLIYEPNRQHEFKIRLAHYKPAGGAGVKTVKSRKLFVMYSYGF